MYGMKRILIFSAALLLCVFTGCSAKDVTATVTGEGAELKGMMGPPSLTVSSGTRELQTWSRSSVWDRGGYPIYADGAFVFDAYLKGDLIQIDAIPGQAIELRFEAMPDRVSVEAWKAECATYDHSRISESIELPVTENTFKVPSDGDYLFEIDAEWDEIDGYGGHAIYSFSTAGK